MYRAQVEPTLADEIPALLAADPGVRGVRLTGSRARGDIGPMSDWDFVIEADDATRVCTRLPSLLSALHAIAFVPDPLSAHIVVAVILRGPVKVDLIFQEEHAPEPPWAPSPENLDAIDAHFWDWTLWLAGKQLKGNDALVERELALMYVHLLQPLGIAATPAALGDAVREYRAARGEWEARVGVTVPRTLDEEVRGALIRNGLL